MHPSGKTRMGARYRFAPGLTAAAAEEARALRQRQDGIEGTVEHFHYDVDTGLGTATYLLDD